MIPIIIIGESDYAEYTNSEKVKNLIRNETSSEYPNTSKIPQLRDKVLELLHKEVAGCFGEIGIRENTILGDGEIIYRFFQNKFQIYLKDVIQKAKGEGK